MPSSACKKSARSEEHTSELQPHDNLVCRLLLEKKSSCSQQRDPGVSMTIVSCILLVFAPAALASRQISRHYRHARLFFYKQRRPAETRSLPPRPALRY